MRIGGKAPGGGPILSVGIECHVSNRFPPPRIVDRQSPLWMPAASVEQGKEMISRGSLACRTQGDAVQWLANGDKSPECDEQLARQRDDHCFARGATAIGRAGLVPLGQCAVLLKPQKRARRVGSSHGGPGHCRLWQAL